MSNKLPSSSSLPLSSPHPHFHPHESKRQSSPTEVKQRQQVAKTRTRAGSPEVPLSTSLSVPIPGSLPVPVPVPVLRYGGERHQEFLDDLCVNVERELVSNSIHHWKIVCVGGWARCWVSHEPYYTTVKLFWLIGLDRIRLDKITSFNITTIINPLS